MADQTAQIDWISPAPVALPARGPHHATAGAGSSRERGERMGNLALARAERVQDDFRERAQSFVLEYLRRYGATSGELVTSMAIASGINPPDERAFGPIFSALSRRKQIVTVGWCLRRKGNCTGGGRIWALL